ncbi:MAG: GAF domain-containing protein [Bdellovibrionales bacterium]|nr:GAF domain-containing protein [Bdellovibrionales bacterium]
MSAALEDLVRQTLCVISEGELCRKATAPEGWPQSKIQSLDQLNACADRAVAQAMRLILIVGEEELSRSLQLLNLKKEVYPQFIFGVLLVSKDPKNFLKKQGLPFHVLDILSDKEAKSQLDYFLLKSLRPQGISQGAGTKIIADTIAKLNSIFFCFSQEKVQDKLFEKIVTKAIEFGECSAATLFILKEQYSESYFVSKVFGELNTPLEIEKKRIPVFENSICGYVALTGKIHTLFNFQTGNSLVPGNYNRSYDYAITEGVDSIITLPLKNSHNEVEAVLQLIYKNDPNKVTGKRKTHFDFEDETLWTTFSTQAGICLESVELYADVQGLFEGFVRASVKAIEARDPSTGGHSERVAKMSVGLAKAVTESEVGTYRSVKFRDEEIRELEYAAMLHDFGKIGVREEVLVKAKKLHGSQLTGIKERIKICKAAAKIHLLENKLNSSALLHPKLELDYQKRSQELDHYWQIIQSSNSPSILKQEGVVALERIKRESLLLPDGQTISLLSDEEYQALSISQGTLTPDERLEIESHVKHTYQFLKMIPWTRDFKNLTEIAHCHHEKLDGTGYPRKLTSHQIPLQSKIMTIADIFDALTAKDRWYKESVPLEKATEILCEEVKQGKLDEALVEIFIAKQIYEHTILMPFNRVA